MPFPRQRLRRLRGKEALRKMVRETRLSVDDLIQNVDHLARLPREKVQRLLDRGTGGYNWGMSGGRGKFVQQFSWSIPCKEAVDAILKYAQDPVYDPMAGSGFWANSSN